MLGHLQTFRMGWGKAVLISWLPCLMASSTCTVLQFLTSWSFWKGIWDLSRLQLWWATTPLQVSGPFPRLFKQHLQREPLGGIFFYFFFFAILGAGLRECSVELEVEKPDSLGGYSPSLAQSREPTCVTASSSGCQLFHILVRAWERNWIEWVNKEHPLIFWTRCSVLRVVELISRCRLLLSETKKPKSSVAVIILSSCHMWCKLAFQTQGTAQWFVSLEFHPVVGTGHKQSVFGFPSHEEQSSIFKWEQLVARMSYSWCPVCMCPPQSQHRWQYF